MIFINMAKIRITESQYEAIQESENVIEDFRVSINDAIKVLNAQFGRLAFSSMADVLDGDIDLEVINRKMDEYENIYYTKSKRVSDFFKNYTTDDEYDKKWIDIDDELEKKGTFMIKKVDSIRILISHLQNIADIDVEQHFPDIETRKI